MDQITVGLRRALNSPIIYDLFQHLMGADQRRREIADEYIRPFPSMRILDIGCGTARILDYLPPSVDYHGFDLSQRYIDEAGARYIGRGHFRCALVEEETFKERSYFDLVLAVGVLHHLNDGAVLKLLKLAKSALCLGGRFVSIDPCFAPDQNPIARFLISKDRGQNVRFAEGYENLAYKSFSKVSGFVKHRKWIPYTHWVMECVK